MDDMFNKFNNISNARKKAIDNNRNSYAEQSKQRLIAIIRKKMQTTFIGSLARFEEKFGFLWGFVDEDIEITREQKAIKEDLAKIGLTEKFFKQLWSETRTNVLDNGNDQLYALEKEIEQYSLKWNRNIFFRRVE